MQGGGDGRQQGVAKGLHLLYDYRLFMGINGRTGCFAGFSSAAAQLGHTHRRIQ